VQPWKAHEEQARADSRAASLHGNAAALEHGNPAFRDNRKSGADLLIFPSLLNGITKDFRHGEFRSGDAHTATGTVEILKESFAKFPPSEKLVIIRADKTHQEKTLSLILLNPFTRDRYCRVSVSTNGMEKQISFRIYQASYSGRPWRTTHSFSMGKYSYQEIVTTMKLTPLNTRRFYNERASVELIIIELKSDYPIGKIPTKHFAAYETYFYTPLFCIISSTGSIGRVHKKIAIIANPR
jgi:hypothetical protein